MKKIILALAVLAIAVLGLAFLSASSVTAQEEQVQATEVEGLANSYETSQPTLLPNSRFYFLKDWWRGLRENLTLDPTKKAELRLQFAQERLVEIKKLVEEKKEMALQNKEKVLAKALEKYNQDIESIKGLADRIKDATSTSERVANFLDKYAHQQIVHTQILEKLKEQVPDEIYQKIEQNRQKHLEKFGQVMEKLEAKEEMIQERIENALDKAEQKIENWQEKKQEILENIKENLPEKARQRWQERRENKPNEPILGADKDDQGCIGSAGYTWCESKAKCLRVWEEDCPEQEQEQN